jgi:3-deoxy-D-manno-octulosonic acid (KDO) 8-phosphate synthase
MEIQDSCGPYNGNVLVERETQLASKQMSTTITDCCQVLQRKLKIEYRHKDSLDRGLRKCFK